MQANTKIWASASGVCVASAVVIGAVLGGSGSSPTHQQPAGNAVSVTTTVGATAPTSASPTTAAVVAARTSASTPKPKRAAVVNQEPPVTDPAATDPAVTDAPAPDPTTSAPISDASSTDEQQRPDPDGGGVVRKPRPTAGPTGHPAPPPGVPTTPSDSSSS